MSTFRKGVWGVGYSLLAVFASQSASGQVLHESAKLLASDGAVGDQFAHVSVSISGDTAIVGALGNDDNGSDSGSAYVYQRDQGGPDNWGEVTKITPGDGAAGDWFGWSVAISGDTAIVAAILDDDNGSDSGSVYVYRRDQGGPDNWGQVTKFTPSDGAAGDQFGISVAISGDTVIVGAYEDDDNGSNSGSAYVYRRDQGGPDNWGQVTKITPGDGAAFDYFGVSVSVSGDTAIVGARAADGNESDSGAAYVYRRDQGGADNWGLVKKLTAGDGAAGDQFGISVSISGDTTIVGAHLDDDNGSDSGSVYAYRRDQGGADNWGQVTKITPGDGAGGDMFGERISISADTAVVGAEGDDDNGANSGSGYVYRRNQGGVDNWGQVVKITASDGAADDRFGDSVSISASLVLVGAFFDDDNGANSGSAYVFNLNVVLGTCCISNGSCEAAGNCQENITPSECQALGGRFFGPDLSCAEVCANGSCIPTVSTWGIVVLLLLLATAGTIVLVRRRIPAR